MSEAKKIENMKNAVSAFMKPSTSAIDKNGPTGGEGQDQTSIRHSSVVDELEKGQGVGKRKETIAGVGKAFQFITRTLISKRNRLAQIVEAQNDYLRKFGLGTGVVAYAEEGPQGPGWKGKLKTWTINPASDLHYTWVTIITLAVLYNMVTIIMRAVFSEIQKEFSTVWYTLDYICDFFYLIDMIFRFRTGYLEQGLVVRDFKKLSLHYIRSLYFTFDLISILPTDLIYFFGYDNIGVRANRLLRLPRLLEFTERTETGTSWPNAFRVACLIMYIVIIIHWNGCLYFAFCELIGLGNDTYVYDNKGRYDSLTRRYIYSVYWSTLSLTTIGETPSPVTDLEHLFNIVDYFVGVLIFASIVGNVGSMITNMNAARTEFQNRMDAVKQYMGFQKVGKELENRVIKWFDYLWSNKQSLSDHSILDTLPDKLRAEIAIHVHFDTLRKVKIFQDCEAGLLAEMVLKLRLQVFSPGDYICRKGDIGKEMYIVKQGKLHVVSDDGKTIFATLTDGAVFGELSILNIAGNKTGNRRTANVRSVGYSDLFALSKDALWDALKEYPEARKILIQKGREILKKDNLLDEQTSDESETLDEKSDRLDTIAENLQTRFARLMAEYTNTHRKLTDRIRTIEKKLNKYKNSDLMSTTNTNPQIELPKQDEQNKLPIFNLKRQSLKSNLLGEEIDWREDRRTSFNSMNFSLLGDQ